MLSLGPKRRYEMAVQNQKQPFNVANVQKQNKKRSNGEKTMCIKEGSAGQVPRRQGPLRDAQDLKITSRGERGDHPAGEVLYGMS